MVAALLCCSGVLAGEPPRAQPSVRVFAAASLTNVLEEIATQWQRAGHARPRLAVGASSILAKQIEAGAPADLYASADPKWMDYLQARGRIVEDTRVDLLGNSLVLIAPKAKPFDVAMRGSFDLARAFDGKLCMGEPDTVPAGVYARQALETLGWWRGLQGRIVGTDDVRAALAFVERGECAAGIVYATDARVSERVAVIAVFPDNSHAPIVTSFAVVKNARPQAGAFLQYLHTPAAKAIFRRHGFTLRED